MDELYEACKNGDCEKTFICDEFSTFYCLACIQCHNINDGWDVCDECFEARRKN